jgi:spore germination protein GerM
VKRPRSGGTASGRKSRGALTRRRRKGRLLPWVIGICVVAAVLAFAWKFATEVRKPAPGRKPTVEKKPVLLYFSDGEGQSLVGEKRDIPRHEKTEDEAKELVAELARGSRGKLIPTLPSAAKLLGFRIDPEGRATADFNRSLVKDHPGGSSAELLTVYSIVQTLTHRFPEIRSVRILVEGKAAETLAGHLSLDRPFAPRPDLVAGKKG